MNSNTEQTTDQVSVASARSEKTLELFKMISALKSHGSLVGWSQQVLTQCHGSGFRKWAKGVLQRLSFLEIEDLGKWDISELASILDEMYPGTTETAAVRFILLSLQEDFKLYRFNGMVIMWLPRIWNRVKDQGYYMVCELFEFLPFVDIKSYYEHMTYVLRQFLITIEYPEYGVIVDEDFVKYYAETHDLYDTLDLWIEKHNFDVDLEEERELYIGRKFRKSVAYAQGWGDFCGDTQLAVKSIAAASLGIREDVKHVTCAFDKVADKVDIKIDQIAGDTARLTDSATTLLDMLTEYFSTHFSGVSKYVTVDAALLLLDLSSDVSTLYKLPLARIVTYLIRIFRIFSPDNFNYVFDVIRNYFSDTVFPGQTISQGDFGSMMTGTIAAIGAIVIGACPTQKQTRDIVEKLKVVSVLSSAAGNMSVFVERVLEMAPKCVQEWAAMLLPYFRSHMMVKDVYSEVLTDMENYTKLKAEQIIFDVQLTEKVLNTKCKLDSCLRAIYSSLKGDHSTVLYFRSMVSKFEKLCDAVELQNECSSIRKAPYSVTLYGGSQIGKSTLSSMIASYMFPNVPAKLVKYSVPTNPDEHWNGYNPNIPVTSEDDADQDAEYTTALTFYSIVTNAPYPVPMASLDNPVIGTKATVYKSLMHLRCTNIAYPNPVCKVNSVDAYLRRRHLLIECRVRPEYMDGSSVLYDQDFKHLEYYMLDPVHSSKGAVYIGNTWEMLQFLKRKYQEHSEKQEKIVSSMLQGDVEQRMRDAYEVMEDANSEGLMEHFDRANEKVSDIVDRLLRYLNEHDTVKRVLQVSALVGGFLFGYKLLGGFLTKAALGVAEMLPSGDSRTIKLNKMNQKRTIAEGTIDATAEQITRNVAHMSQNYTVVENLDIQEANAMCGIFIGGKYVLYPYHLFITKEGEALKNAKMTIHTQSGKFVEWFNPQKLIRLKTQKGQYKDVAVYECGAGMHLWKDRRHLFVSEADLAYVSNMSPGTLNKFKNGMASNQIISISRLAKKEYLVTEKTHYVMINGFTYEATTERGDCGSIVVLHNTRIKGKFIGMHVAGTHSSFTGYSELVTCEMLDAFKPRMIPADVPLDSGDKPVVTLSEGCYSYYGTVPRDQSVYPVEKTEIRKSLIHGEITQPVTAPAKLGKEIFQEATAKYFGNPIPPRPDFNELLRQNLFDLVDCLKQPVEGVVSEDIAINGDPKEPHMESMNMHSSPGLPYKLLSKKRGKIEWFDALLNGKKRIPDKGLLREKVDERLTKAKNGELVESIWMDIAKDERRTIGKATRVITVPPLDHSVLFRMYFLEFINAFVSNKLNGASAIGIDPYSFEWTDLINKLLAKSNLGFAGDYKKFDGNVDAEYLQNVIDAINYYYRYEREHEERKKVREVLFYEIIHTLMQLLNLLYRVHHGVPSGCIMTSIIDTMVGEQYLLLAWLGLAPLEMRNIKSFHDNVEMALYGDDNIVAVTAPALEFFNAETIAKELATYNITYTSTDKIGKIVPWDKIENLSFLKNTIRREGMIYHATMEEATIYEMVNWIRESDDPVEATVVNCNCALRFWFHYGKERFEDERSKIMSALSRKIRDRFTLHSYGYFNECFNTDRVPEMFVTDAYSQGGEGTVAGEINDANVVEESPQSGALSFLEQKPSVHIDQSISPLRSDNMMFGAWPASRIFGKPMRVGTYEFKTAGQPKGTILKIIDIPDVIDQIKGSWSTYASAFTFFKARPVLRVQLNGNRFSAGRLMVHTVPYNLGGQPFVTGAAVGTLLQVTALPHAFLDASSNDVVEITAPWVVPYEWFNLAVRFGSGTAGRYSHLASTSQWTHRSMSFYLRVFNELVIAVGGTTSIYATVWIHFEDVEFCVPRVGDSTSQGASVSTQIDSRWGKIALKVLPKNVTGDSFDIAGGVGAASMDKPSNTLNVPYLARRAIGYFSHAKNIENIQRMAMYPDGQSDINFTDFGTNQDEMDLKYLCSKFTYWFTATISTSQLTGTSLLTIPITPYIVPFVGGNGAPALLERNNTSLFPFTGASPTPFTMPLLGYVSLPFDFWGGSLKYRFDFITNSFVTAKVFCAIIYGTLAPETATTGIEPSTALGYTFEINADRKTFEIAVPYVSEFPWKRVMRSQFKQAGTSNVNASYDDNIPLESCIGQIALYVMNPLASPIAMPTTYDINVFVAGGDDFRLNFLSRSNLSYVAYAQGLDPNPGTDLAFLGQTLMKTDIGVMSEQYTNIRDILKRYTHVFTQFVTVPIASVSVGPTTFPYSVPINIGSLMNPWYRAAGSVNVQRSVWHWFAALYRFYRGSLRFRILIDYASVDSPVFLPQMTVDYFPDNVNIPGRSWLLGPTDYGNQPNQTDPPVANLNLGNSTHFGPRDMANDHSNFVEIEIPYVHYTRIRPTFSAPNTATSTDSYVAYDRTVAAGNRAQTFGYSMNEAGTLVVNVPQARDAEYAVTIHVYMAAGDDFRFGCQNGTPSVAYLGWQPVGSTTVNSAVPPDFYN